MGNPEFRVLLTRLRRAIAVIRFGLLTLRYAGLRYALQKLEHQLYGHTIFLHTIRDLNAPIPPPIFSCYIVRASPEDIKDLFNQIRYESNEGKYQLLVRKWYHESRFGDCYVAKTSDTSEICNVHWMVTPEHIRQLGWEERFPLTDDEVMLENVYTLGRYRRMGVSTTCGYKARENARRKGFKRTKGYIDENNTPQLMSMQKSDTRISAKVLERHFLFRVTRKTLEQYDPPIPVATFLEKPPGDSR